MCDNKITTQTHLNENVVVWRSISPFGVIVNMVVGIVDAWVKSKANAFKYSNAYSHRFRLHGQYRKLNTLVIVHDHRLALRSAWKCLFSNVNASKNVRCQIFHVINLKMMNGKNEHRFRFTLVSARLALYFASIAHRMDGFWCEVNLQMFVRNK